MPTAVGWSVWMDSNHRPHAYQACALTTWATNRFSHSIGIGFNHLLTRLGPGTAGWWRWWESNPWPPACRAGALPAELHPRIYGFVLFQWSFTNLFVSDPWKLNNKSSIRASLKTSLVNLTTRSPWKDLMVSIERRWSSRTFRYGYLVTT